MAAITDRPSYVSGDHAAIEHIQYDVDRSRRAAIMRHNEVLIRDARRSRRRQQVRTILTSPGRFIVRGISHTSR